MFLFKKYNFLILIFSCLIVATSLAQVTQADAEIQAKYIEGNQKKILGKYEEATVLFKEILKIDPTNDAAAFELARVYSAWEKKEDAVKYAKKAYEIDQENIWYPLFLGDLLSNYDRDDEAAEVYRNLVKKYPDSEEFHYKLAYYLVRAAKPKEALEVYKNLEKKTGFNEELARRQHTIYLAMGEMKKAGAVLKKLCGQFPENAKYKELLAGFYESNGQMKKAEAVYKSILELEPDNAKAQLALAGNFKKNDNDIAYLSSLKPVFQQKDMSIDLKVKELFPFIQKVAEQGDESLANACLELSYLLEEVHPNDAKGYSISADLLYFSNQKTAARDKYIQTLDINRSVFLVWENLLQVLEELKDYKSLLKYSEKALDLFPNQSFVYYMEGLALGQLNKKEEAIYELEQGLLMVGKNNQLRFDFQKTLGLIYHELKKYARSENAFKEALLLNPNSDEVLNLYSHCLADRGDQLELAKSMITKANKIKPNQPEYMETYGWVMYKLNSFTAAQEWLEKAVKLEKEMNPESLEKLGDTYFKLNNTEEAVMFWQKALNILGNHPPLEKKISEAKL